MDFDTYSEMVKIINDFNPDIIGISVMTFYKKFVHRAAKYIRDAGVTAPLFLGGPYTTGDYKSGLQDENINLCMLGEGEITLADLVGRMINNGNKLPPYDELKQIPGIALLEKPFHQNININQKNNLEEKNFGL